MYESQYILLSTLLFYEKKKQQKKHEKSKSFCKVNINEWISLKY